MNRQAPPGDPEQEPQATVEGEQQYEGEEHVASFF